MRGPAGLVSGLKMAGKWPEKPFCTFQRSLGIYYHKLRNGISVRLTEALQGKEIRPSGHIRPFRPVSGRFQALRPSCFVAGKKPARGPLFQFLRRMKIMTASGHHGAPFSLATGPLRFLRR